MKLALLSLSLILFISCNSVSKKDPGTELNNDTTVIAEPPADTSSVKEDNLGKIDLESFGSIKLGQFHTETIRVLGEPGSKTKAVEWGADGLMHEDWTWKDLGLELNMSSEKGNASGTLAIFSITAKAPCAFKTKAGIGIGSTVIEVQNAYKKDISPEESSKDQITVGSVYGGIIFTIKNEKVASIFLGAAAE